MSIRRIRATPAKPRPRASVGPSTTNKRLAAILRELKWEPQSNGWGSIATRQGGFAIPDLHWDALQEAITRIEEHQHEDGQ